MELSQKSLAGIQNFFLFQGPMNIKKDWKAKLKSAYSFMLKYSKITVCDGYIWWLKLFVKDMNLECESLSESH